ncbi:MAG: adenylate/guanylate cyclase domain-containing response regulator [Planctomycetes bacterium]|nr:adenylate/guanylate cyclase domain-containing response regulator [Planctomycetota bacterium]
MPSRVLVVEDQALMRKLIARVLESNGHDVIEASSGQEALLKLLQFTPDLVILDIEMPDMNGFEVCAAIREEDPHTPIIFCTADTSSAVLQKAFSVGGNDFVKKPFTKTELNARIQNCLDLSSTRKKLEKQVKLFKKFVPEIFLDNKHEFSLEFDTVYNVACKLEADYSILFVDIRNFTTFSENISGKECFNFMSSYYKRVEPIISMFKGFVYQYLGDGTLALFPVMKSGCADNALHAAVSIVDGLKIYNDGRVRAGYTPIEVGVGINTGTVALGIAGTDNRMSSGAYGNTVNLASRCEGLCKKYKADIIISEHTYEAIENKDSFLLRYLGKEQIKGLKNKVGIFEVYSANTPEARKEKSGNLLKIKKMISSLQVGKYEESAFHLDKLVEDASHDKLPEILKDLYYTHHR